MTHRALLRRFLFRLFTAVIGITLCTSTALALPLTDAIVQGDIRIQLEPVATGLTAPEVTVALADHSRFPVPPALVAEVVDLMGRWGRFRLCGGSRSRTLDLDLDLGRHFGLWRL